MKVETKKEKILKLLLSGNKSESEIGKEIAYDRTKGILYKNFENDLKQLQLEGCLIKYKNIEEIPDALRFPKPSIIIKKKQLGKNKHLKPGRPVTGIYSVFDINCIRKIYNKYTSLAPAIHLNRVVQELIIVNNPSLPYIGIKGGEEEPYADEYVGEDNYIPEDYLSGAKYDFIVKIEYSQQMFELCLNYETENLKKAFEDIYSLVYKTNTNEPEYYGPAINGYTEKGFLASDIIFEACLFVDMLKGNDCKKGIEYLELKKNLIRRSKVDEILKQDFERSVNNPPQKLDFSKFNQTVKGK